MGDNMRLRNKKTGGHGEYKVVSAGYLIRVRNCDTNESYQYDSIAGFSDDWEDYKPDEPLIKDKKIRKAVRAWAEASDIESVYLSSEALCWIEGFAKIEFAGNRDWFKELEDGKRYTITELCGEEEE